MVDINKNIFLNIKMSNIINDAKPYQPIITHYNSPDEVPYDDVREMGRLHQLKCLRKKRNELLMETDKYLLPDFPVSKEELEQIKVYRQNLRDIPNNNFVFPSKPDFLK